MLECLSQRVRDLRPNAAQGRRLTVVPIQGPSGSVPHYELMTPGNLCKIRVAEVSDAGQVPVLRVTNDLDARLFLMDGQELVGAKQNRILNTDVLVPARSTLQIPVSCVEQGRWRSVSKVFTPGRSASHRIRAAKAARVRESLKAHRGHDADQRAVWDEVQQTLNSTQTSTATAALSDSYQSRRDDLQRLRADVRLPERTVGMAVFHRGEFLGLDLFDRASTLEFFWASLADSYAIDLLHLPEAGSPTPTPEAGYVQTLLPRISSRKWERFSSPGEGADWRLDDRAYAASALVWDEQAVIHLQVFPRSSTPNAPVPHPRIRRPYGGRDGATD